jgi:DNA-binding MarR family transcriptional regulator
MKLLMHLRTINPWGDRLSEAEVKPIAAELNVTPRTVQRALVGLAEKDLIELEINKFKFRIKKLATEMSQDDKMIASRDRNVAEGTNRSQVATEMSPERQKCRERSLELPQHKGSETSHTIQILLESSDSFKKGNRPREVVGGARPSAALLGASQTRFHPNRTTFWGIKITRRGFTQGENAPL